MGYVKMFEIVLLWCIINTKLVVDAYDDDFENDYIPIRNALLAANNVEEDELKASNHPATDFLVHTSVTPKIYHGREKREISTTLEENGKHTDHIEITMDIEGTKLTLDLTLNRQLIPQGFFHKQQMNGEYETFRPNFQESNLCEYSGKVRGVPNSWVAISTCEGISGVIFDGNELHYVQKGNNMESSTESDHILYSHSNLAMNNRIMRYKRFANSTVLREPYNVNEESRYVELLLVMDNEVYKEHGESKLRTLNYAKSIANIVNALYARLNIFVALVGVVIWSEYDEITMTSNGDRMLGSFLKYRKENLQKHPNDNAQLITKQNFEGGVVAKALKGPICTFEYSGGINTDFSPVVGVSATTVAHSLGHNFGMEHDTSECKCPKEQCIMSRSVQSGPRTDWSSCSVNYLKHAFSRGMDYCLRNIPKWLSDGPVCGNGFLEEGEQCDCGLPEYCNNSCCNAETCTMRSNATCAHGKCCDIETCSLKVAGTLCRSASSECDLEEYCNGYSEICPDDYHKLDAEVCDSGNAYCYQGSCKSRADQCKLLWGETGTPSDTDCYKFNTRGLRFGNCGYNKLTNSFLKCEDGNQLCGMLHCKHLNERLEFGMEAVAILSHVFLQKEGQIIPCRTALVDLGLDRIDPGLTPNGAPCGLEKMCVNQKCISVSELRNQGPSCLQNCNGNGWCNNKGNCQCKVGFAPPHCDFPGPGGSIDSSPASDPKAMWKNFQAPSSSAVINTTKSLTDTTTPAIHSNTARHFNDSVTNLNDTGAIARNSNTSINSNTSASQPVDTPNSLNNISTNTTSQMTTDLNNVVVTSEATSLIQNSTGTNFNGTATNSNGTAANLNGTATNLNGIATNLNGTATNSNGTATNLNDTETNSSGTATNLNGTATNLIGTATNLNGAATNSNGTATNLNDTETNSNGTATNLNGTATNSNGTATNSNDTETNSSGTVTNLNGTKMTSDASVLKIMPVFLVSYVNIGIYFGYNSTKGTTNDLKNMIPT